MRINARLEGGYASKLEYIIRITGLSISSVIKKSIELLYDHVRFNKTRPSHLLEKTGFIGGFHGPANLSTNYKEELFKN